MKSLYTNTVALIQNANAKVYKYQERELRKLGAEVIGNILSGERAVLVWKGGKSDEEFNAIVRRAYDVIGKKSPAWGAVITERQLARDYDHFASLPTRRQLEGFKKVIA